MSIAYDQYGFREMLAGLGKKHLPQRHGVTDLIADPFADQYLSQVVSDEFYPRYVQAPVTILRSDIIRVSGKHSILELLECRFESAFMCVRYYIDRMWSHEVLPSDVPSGE